jgi:hypothetical protein
VLDNILYVLKVWKDGFRQVLGIVEGAKEDKAGWSGL